jgi:hypothetical protein
MRCMLDLTDDDLAIAGQPGIFDFPRVVDGPRPATNRSDRPLTYAQVQKAYDALQSEGYDEPESADNTPWQKGDDKPY